MEQMPILDFSKWYWWEKRSEFPGKTNPGVYAIAITEKDLDNGSFNWENVVYIGMSNSRKGLEDRWSFLVCAIKNKPNGHHSGGIRIYESRGHYKEWKRVKMFVAAHAVYCNPNKGDNRTPEDIRKKGKVSYLEFEALAQYKEKIGKEPEYNKR